MKKAYLYKGKKYSDDYWRDTDDNDFDGSLWDLLEELVKDKNNKLESFTVTYFLLDGEPVGNENDIDPESIIEHMIGGGYLNKSKVVELPTEDDMPDTNWSQTEYTVEVDPDSPFGVE